MLTNYRKPCGFLISALICFFLMPSTSGAVPILFEIPPTGDPTQLSDSKEGERTVIQLNLGSLGGLETPGAKRLAGPSTRSDWYASSLGKAPSGRRGKWVRLAIGLGAAGALLALTVPADDHSLLAASLRNPPSRGAAPVAITEPPVVPTGPEVPKRPDLPATPFVPVRPSHPSHPVDPSQPSDPPDQPAPPQPVALGYEPHQTPRDIPEPNVLGLFCAAAFASVVAARRRRR